jgi:hypothetical protein
MVVLNVRGNNVVGHFGCQYRIGAAKFISRIRVLRTVFTFIAPWKAPIRAASRSRSTDRRVSVLGFGAATAKALAKARFSSRWRFLMTSRASASHLQDAGLSVEGNRIVAIVATAAASKILKAEISVVSLPRAIRAVASYLLMPVCGTLHWLTLFGFSATQADRPRESACQTRTQREAIGGAERFSLKADSTVKPHGHCGSVSSDNDRPAANATGQASCSVHSRDRRSRAHRKALQPGQNRTLARSHRHQQAS